MSFPTIDNIYAEGDRSCSGMAYLDPYLYVLYWGGWPAYDPKVHKINPITYEKIAEWTAPYQAAMASSICTDCEYIYVGTSNRGSTGHHYPLHVYKIDPATMTTVASFTGYGTTGDTSAVAIQFDFQSKRLIVLDDRNIYRIWKLKQDLTEEMHKDAESGWPPSQWHGNDLTLLGDYFFVASGGTPGEIIKRRISDLEMVDYFQGTFDDPDDYIEGIFFNICNDGHYLYTATYDYMEKRPARLIKVNPSDMTRVGTYYGASDELLAYGSYAYGGKVYMLLYGRDGVYWPNQQEGEVVIQVDPTTMTRSARYVNWTGEWNSAYRAVGDGSRLHVGFWGDGGVFRSVLQFAESGAELCAPSCGLIALGDKVMLCPIGNQHGNTVALKSGNAAVTDKALIASLNNQAALKLDFRNCKTQQGDKIICVPVSRAKKNILGLR